jgi:ribose/xylose/arabinose/galactoside ABC-type transport system permease subunit
MSVEEGSFAASSRYLGEGFRQEPDFRDGPTDTVSSLTAATSTSTGIGVAVTDPELAGAAGSRPAATNLDYVFDDPAHGEPGRDRILVHLLWELVLLLAAAGVGYLLYRHRAGAFSGDDLRTLLLNAASLGMLAAAAGLTLRAGAPNLALGAVAVASGLYYIHSPGSGVLPALLVVIGIAAAIGAVQGLVIVGLHVPSWAVSLAVGLGVFAWVEHLETIPFAARFNPVPQAYYWVGGVFGVSLIASLIGLLPVVRRTFGRFRPVVDPAQRRGLVAAVIVVAATVASTVLAGVAGVLALSVSHQAVASDGLSLTALAFGAALLGGASAFGRRGGLFGTVFAVALVIVTRQYLTETNRFWGEAALAAAMIGVGLVVTRLVERFGRPEQQVDIGEEEDWVPAGHAAGAGRTSSVTTTTTWPLTSPTTTSATTASGGLWASDEAWGSSDSR